MKRMWVWLLDMEIAKALKVYAHENGMKRCDTQRILKSILASPQLAMWEAGERRKERPHIVIKIAVTSAARKESPEGRESCVQSQYIITSAVNEDQACSIQIKVTVA